MRLTVDTAVGRELAWRLHTELLELPYRDGERVSAKDALAETILADPRVVAAIAPALEAIGAHGEDPALRQRLEDAMAEYARTRAAATEITTAMLTLGTGALAVQKVTPGAATLGPMLAAAIAQQSAVASFPMGAALGSVWVRAVSGGAFGHAGGNADGRAGGCLDRGVGVRRGGRRSGATGAGSASASAAADARCAGTPDGRPRGARLRGA